MYLLLLKVLTPHTLGCEPKNWVLLLSLFVYFERFRLKLEEVEKAFWVILGRFSKAGKWTFMCPSGEGKCHF